MNYLHDDNSNYRERYIVEYRVNENAEHQSVRHHRWLAPHTYTPGAKNVGSMEGGGAYDVDDGEPDHDRSGSDDSSNNPFTYGVVPLSHRSSSEVVSLA